MITRKELNKRDVATTPEIDSNLDILLARLNKVRELYGKPMTVTSGLRSLAQQLQINPSATKSKHLYGQAADIADPKQELQTWCYDNVEYLEEIGLWCEAFQATPTWVHFQTLPPRSGHRFFAP